MKKYTLSLTSAFSTPSLLKARIQMLYRKPSATFALAKFGFALPTLVLCVLFTAFTQRERILPASFAKEAEQVAQRFMGEVQKAFLPEPKVIQSIFTHEVQKETIKNKIVSKQSEVTNDDISVKHLAHIEAIKPDYNVFLENNIIPKQDIQIAMPTIISDSLKKKSKKKSKKYSPFFLEEYRYVAQRNFKPNSIRNMDIVLEKNELYVVQFYNIKDRKFIDVPIIVTVFQEGKELSIIKNKNGYEFTTPNTRVCNISFKNTPKNIPLSIIILKYDKNAEFPKADLLNEKGESRRFSAWGINPTPLNQKFRLVFEKTGIYTDLEIHEVLVTVRSNRTQVLFEKVFKTSEFDLSDLPVQKGDKVIIQITEFSGKLNGKVVENPKAQESFMTTTFGYFMIIPLVK